MQGAPQITEVKVKSVATESRGFGSPGEFSLNPYRGCTFGCAYCYAKKFIFDDTKKRYDWGHWVEVKTNAADALLKELPKLFDKEIFVGSATDPYQPIEKRLGLTRQLLEILLLAHPRHVHIQTRSPHIVRDIDVLKAFGSTLSVGISIPTDSEVVRKAFEPRAPSLARRIETGKQLREAGITVSASVAPLLPCTPKRLAAKLAPAFDKVWVGRINFYGDEGGARAIYSEHGWDKYLRASHETDVKAALKEFGLYHHNSA
ncbi:MAG: radical SAM protein [Armatimonas sp.]